MFLKNPSISKLTKFFAGSIVIEREADVEDSKPLVVPSKSDRVITTVDNSNAAAATDKVGADGSYEHFRMVNKCFLMNCDRHSVQSSIFFLRYFFF